MIYINVTEKQLREICRKCIENTNGLLDSAGLLLANKNTQQYALGLYMYAVEEYGKARLLKGCFTGNNKSAYSIPRWIFGGRDKPPSGRNSHEEKLLEGFKNLPQVCLKLSRVLELEYNTSPITSTFVLKRDNLPDDVVSVPAGASGIAADTTYNPSRDVDFDLKTACFYIDWDPASSTPKFIMPADREQLTHNIRRAKEVVKTFDFV